MTEQERQERIKEKKAIIEKKMIEIEELYKLVPEEIKKVRPKNICQLDHLVTKSVYVNSKNIESHKAITAFSLLMCYRNVWIGDWKPNFIHPSSPKYCIDFMAGIARVGVYWSVSRPLSFPCEEMAQEF